MIFVSDNAVGVAPEILAAMTEAAEGSHLPYGNDVWTQGLEERFKQVFETDDLHVMPIATGTAANALTLSAMMPAYGRVLCHEVSHIYFEEISAVEFFSGGGRLVPMPGENGKLDPADLRRHVERGRRGNLDPEQPFVVSISQMNEMGIVYQPEEIARIGDFCREFGYPLHMDGARFANALAGLGCAPADITWRAGVDALSFGATKNGGYSSDAIVFFGPVSRKDVELRFKRSGHIFSKAYALSSQLTAYLEDDLWLRNARHANAMAAMLADRLENIGIRLESRPDGNEVFAHIPDDAVTRLRDAGGRFYPWHLFGDDAYRLVTSWTTSPADIDRFLSIVSASAA